MDQWSEVNSLTSPPDDSLAMTRPDWAENSVSEALPSLSDRTRTFWVRMEIIESFQAFENLADRTFRGRSLGYQDEYEPEVDVAERSNARRMRRTVPWSAGRGHPSCGNRCAT